ncbi:hypothetical protein AVEN_76412-1 [Araneus ventricosus]|uniref:Uncharacterized protein n=1 Tax=Araneus ventricosus TaxID=182803 RepID=A0A4Y2TPL6_ARAVE|nr:hypothetical protein AVEN_76412-1 [Araneus ventricosus]
MESVVIETLGCPLDPDLLKSWEKFSLESSHSRISSDHSESADEENEIKHDDLIEQLKNLSFDDVSDSKSITSKRSNKISEINSQEKDNSGELIFVENKETDENQSSSSSLKNKELLKFVVEADTESTFCKSSNKNYETNSKKKHNTEKPSFVENLEDVENQLSSLLLKNNKLLNKYYKSGSDISAGYESDSDNDEQDEAVTLRERDPTRHNRPENNKQLRTAPFSRNHSKTSKPHFNANNSQTFGNFSPHIFFDFNTSHHGYDCVSHLNSTDFENGIVSPSSRIFHSGFPTSESVTDEAFEGMVPSIVEDQIFNNVEKETFLDSCFEGLTAEEVENILKNLTDSTLDDLSYQNHVDLIEEFPLHVLSSKEVEKVFNNSSILNQNICVAPTVKEISYPNNSQHNFHPEPDHGHSSFSKANVEETSLFSNLCKENGILEKTGQFYNSEYLVNKPGNYSNLVCKNITSINCESLSPKTSDYVIISNEIEHEIVKLEELEERVKKGQKKVSELSREINWNVFPFDKLDDNAISECINTPENKMSNKKDDSKRKNNVTSNHTTL